MFRRRSWQSSQGGDGDAASRRRGSEARDRTGSTNIYSKIFSFLISSSGSADANRGGNVLRTTCVRTRGGGGNEIDRAQVVGALHSRTMNTGWLRRKTRGHATISHLQSDDIPPR